MNIPLVLDSGGLDALCRSVPTDDTRALLATAYQRNQPVLVPTVVCAELCRGVARTRQVEAALARRSPDRHSGIKQCDTDFALARQVGAILHGAEAATTDIVDAHVVAVCVAAGGGIVVTTDPTDIHRLAQAVPAVHIVTTSP